MAELLSKFQREELKLRGWPEEHIIALETVFTTDLNQNHILIISAFQTLAEAFEVPSRAKIDQPATYTLDKSRNREQLQHQRQDLVFTIQPHTWMIGDLNGEASLLDTDVVSARKSVFNLDTGDDVLADAVTALNKDPDLNFVPLTLDKYRQGTLFAIRDDQQRIILITASLHSVPGPRYEEELQARINFELRAFLGDVIHDMRRPLTSVSTSIEVIKRLLALPHTVEGFEDIRERVMALKSQFSLVVELGATALSMEAWDARDTLNATPVHLGTHIKKELVRIATIYRGVNIKLMTNIDMTLPEVEIDVIKFNGILLNLVCNAFNHTPDGDGAKVTVRLALEPGTTEFDQDMIRLEIEDTGKGMDEETKQKIVDGGHTTEDARGGHGTGRGLEIVRHGVAVHQGTLGIETEIGRGSTFVVRLPFKPVLKEDDQTS